MHPTNGICRVIGMREDDMSEDEKMYVLKPQDTAPGEVSILVPCSKISEAGIRGLLNLDGVDSILKIMESGAENIDDAAKDKKSFREVFRSGSACKVAEAIRDLEKNNEAAPARDIKPFLTIMKDNFADEIAHIRNISRHRANGLIASRLKKNLK